MIRSNVDVIAITVLIAAAALFSSAENISSARKSVIWDVVSQHTAAVKRILQCPNVNSVTLSPFSNVIE
jgi:hypothetical protein